MITSAFHRILQSVAAGAAPARWRATAARCAVAACLVIAACWSGVGRAQTPPVFTTIEPGIVSGIVPKVYWVSQPVRPNETVLASGGNFSPAATVEVVRLADGDAGSPLAAPEYPAAAGWTMINPLQATNSSLKFVLPASWNSGMMAFRVKTGRAILADSDIERINAPDIWWVQGDLGDTGSPGGRLRVQGTAIALPEAGGTPQLALVQGGNVQYLQASRVLSGYSVEFAIPAGTAAGTYDLYVHNGHGGTAGWTQYDTFNAARVNSFTIRTAPAWPRYRQQRRLGFALLLWSPCLHSHRRTRHARWYRSLRRLLSRWRARGRVARLARWSIVKDVRMVWLDPVARRLPFTSKIALANNTDNGLATCIS